MTFSALRFTFYYCTFTDRRGTNMLLWERKCPFYVERKYNSLHKFLSLHTYITDCKQIQWFPIIFFGPSNANYYKESNGTRIRMGKQGLDVVNGQNPLNMNTTVILKTLNLQCTGGIYYCLAVEPIWENFERRVAVELGERREERQPSLLISKHSIPRTFPQLYREFLFIRL